jgi:hypothetical protein
MKMEQSVPKRRHIKFRRRGINQKKTYNIIHLSSAVKTKYVVSDIASKCYQTPPYYRHILSFQLARTSLSQELSPDPAWSSCTITSLISHEQLSFDV